MSTGFYNSSAVHVWFPLSLFLLLSVPFINFANYVVLGSLLNLFVPQFPQLYNRKNNSTISVRIYSISGLIMIKPLNLNL